MPHAPSRGLLVGGLGGGLQEVAEEAAEQVGVAGPARGQVVQVSHGESWPVVGRGAARGEGERSSLELAAGVVQGGFDLVLDVGGIGPVIAAPRRSSGSRLVDERC